ncbi:hypothetical protein H0H92_006904 [Tricholoma furcatifolium]|nr:hypothetical protein H0H92_006904 [Tricholoma furcatifolium]
MASETPISFTVTYRGTPHSISLFPETTLSRLQARLEELTQVPASLQKLLHKGKNLLGSDPNARSQMTLLQAGIKSGLKIQMLGSTSQELTSLQATENEKHKREQILKERALKPQVKLRSTGPGPSASSLLKYRFHELSPLEHLPNPESALALLAKLSEDPAIQHIMQRHQFSVGVLTELAPHEHPELLGLNVNAGQAIKLRLRTDLYDGSRLYKDVRRVLCHELTHNVWGDHDDNFKELNSKLNREVAEFEQAVARGTHYLSDSRDVYQPSSDLEAKELEDREERRLRILNATMARLQKEEEELEERCGTRATKS